MDSYPRSLPLLAFLAFLSGAAAPDTGAATVSVVGGGLVDFDLIFGPARGDEKVSVGFFKDYVEGDPAFIAALHQQSEGLHSYLAANFIPLGEPAAPVFSNYGVSSSLLGSSSTIRFQEAPAGSGLFRPFGSISGITFTDSAPANTLTAAGLPQSSRLFLLVYNVRDPDFLLCALGVYSASIWLAPSSASTLLNLQLANVNTAAESFLGSTSVSGTTTTFRISGVVCMPEPGTGALLLVAFGLLGMRSKSRSQ